VSDKERFPHPYKECFILLLNRCGISQSTPLWGPASLLTHCLVSTPLRGSASSLAHHLVSSSYTICNGTASRYCPPWVFPIELPLKVFKTRLLERGFHSLIKNNSFSSPTDVGSHNPPHFGAQCLCWHTASCLPPFGSQPPHWHITWCLTSIPFATVKSHC